jgi:hypothetical protein
MLARVYYFKGMLNESFAEDKQSRLLAGDLEGAAEVDRIWKTRGSQAAFEWRLDRLKKLAGTRNTSPLKLAELSAAAGHPDEAIHYLQQALDQHNADLIWLKQDPYYDPLHSDPRYLAIVKSVGLP